MIPGMGKQLQGVDVDERQLGRVEAIVLSMTTAERRKPEIIKGSRRARIAAGSGTSVQQVNQLLAARKQMEKMMKQFGRGKMPNIQSIVAQQALGRRRWQHDQIGPHRVEEEPDLPGRRGRLALAARRQVHRDRRPLQPSDASVAIELDEAKIKDWISKGAQPPDSVQQPHEGDRAST